MNTITNTNNMETRATEENILKYFNVLKKLHFLLSNTNRISMFDFSVKNNVTKNLSTVLQKGGIIKMTKKGRYPEWEWNTIEPNREMAIKTLKELALLNPVRHPLSNTTSNRGGARAGSGRKPKSIENRYLKSKTKSFLFGILKIKTTYEYGVHS